MLYADYVKEREGYCTIHDENGFMTYFIQKNECYIRDVYVKPELRQSKVGFKYFEEVCKLAKENGCTIVTGSVRPSANGSTDSLKVMLSVGFKLMSSTNDAIFFVKEL
jgi:ribosomal protein S18 acetylase RimI-like enzyme